MKNANILNYIGKLKSGIWDKYQQLKKCWWNSPNNKVIKSQCKVSKTERKFNQWRNTKQQHRDCSYYWNLAEKHWWRWCLDTLLGIKQLFTPNIDKNRTDRREGTALVTQRKYKIIRKPETKDYESFEHDIWNIQIGPKVYTVIGIYHPPQETDPKVNNTNFLDQWTDLQSHVIPKHQEIIMLGDFNIHISDPKDQDAQILQDTLNAFNLRPHVNIPTHNLGHTIDFIITSNE